MENSIIGTCSICGGAVVVPKYWMCVFPPTPTCQSCGATAGYGPVIDMKPSKTGTTKDAKIDWQYMPSGNAVKIKEAE